VTQNQPFVAVAEVTRGLEVESVHRGAIAVVDSDGHLVASVGNPAEPTFVRSCAKPFQALALLCSGAADHFKLTEEEIAVVCSSHSGEPQQVALVEQVLAKAGLEELHLQCGAHEPFDRQTRRAMIERGESPTTLHNNCSGKHAGMLATAKYLDLPLENYLDPDHGVQLAILGLLASLCGLESEEIVVAMDGCSAPAYYLPLRSFSLALARWAAEGEGLSSIGEIRHDEAGRPDIEPNPDSADGDSIDTEFPVSIAAGLARIWNAMKNHPNIVAGRRGRLCSDLIQVSTSLGRPLVGKSGGEGVYAIATVDEGVGIGLTVKIEDGAQRARDTAAIETLFQLDLLPDRARGPLAGYHRQTLLNHRRDSVGEVRPCFRLHRGLPG